MEPSAKVAVIGVGGTIASIGRDSLDVAAYADTRRKHEVGALLAAFPELASAARLLPVPYRAVGSPAIGPREWLELADLVGRTARDHPDLDGIVLTHGTGTLEETAYFLNLVLKVAIPVVLVGAQRPASALSSDAGMNLLAAVRVAAAPASRGLGVLVVANDEIHAAREVVKTSTMRLDAFASPDFGALGHADPDRVAYYRRPVRRHAPDTPFAVTATTALPRVDIAFAHAGADGVAVEAFVGAGARGIVVAGILPSSAPPAMLSALNAAVAQGVVVVHGARSGSGRLVPVRAGRAEGAVLADNLPPTKARILLMLALTLTSDRDEIQRLFETV